MFLCILWIQCALLEFCLLGLGHRPFHWEDLPLN